MKRETSVLIPIAIVLLLTGVLVLTACTLDAGSSGGEEVETVTFDNATVPGQSVPISVGKVPVNMIYANNRTEMTFPTGYTDSSTATLSNQFFLSETEVTWELMAEVLQWALDNNKIVETTDAHNEVSASTVKYGDQELLDLDAWSGEMKISYDTDLDTFSVATGYEKYPVVDVSWYGAIMFCNWLTEMRDGNTDNVVYTGIDKDWVHTETAETATNTGYRLPSRYESEFAARYINDAECDGVLNTAGEYYPGNFVSGADAVYSADNATSDYDGDGDMESTGDVAWYSGNASAPKETAQKSANALGFYDMSGNIREWCFTASDSFRIIRGGSYINGALTLQVGKWNFRSPFSRLPYIGFRIARTQ